MPRKIDWPTADYTLTQRSYIARRPGLGPELLEAGTVITHDGKPGPHMEPNGPDGERAHDMAGEQSLDFTRKLDMTVNEATGEMQLGLAPNQGPAGDYTPHPAPKAVDMTRSPPPPVPHAPPPVIRAAPPTLPPQPPPPPPPVFPPPPPPPPEG